MRGRNTIDWEAAFAYYASMPRGARSLAKVGRRFGVSDVSVGKAAKREGWAERIALIDAKAAAAVEKRVVRDHEVRIAETIEIVDRLRQQLLERAKAGDVVADITDFVQLVKLEQLLQGDPTERVSVTQVSQVFLGLSRAYDTVLIGFVEQFVPVEQRPAVIARWRAGVTELLEGVTGGLLQLEAGDE